MATTSPSLLTSHRVTAKSRRSASARMSFSSSAVMRVGNGSNRSSFSSPVNTAGNVAVRTIANAAVRR